MVIFIFNTRILDFKQLSGRWMNHIGLTPLSATILTWYYFFCLLRPNFDNAFAKKSSSAQSVSSFSR